MIIPTTRLANAAALTHDVKVMQQKSLTKLQENVRKFFAEFKDLDFRDLSEKKRFRNISTRMAFRLIQSRMITLRQFDLGNELLANSTPKMARLWRDGVLIRSDP